jgi:DNA-binding protein Fis
MKKKNLLEDSVRTSLEQYLQDLGDANPSGMYDMVITCVERPLLEFALEHADQNQSRAAEFLGITRNTLRKKLLAYKLLTATS